MRPLRIYLIRHGESDGNVDNTIYKHTPDWKINLTERGRQQADYAGKQLQSEIDKKSAIIYTSPWYRAKQTAEIANIHLRCRLFEDPRIREQEWGNYQEEEFKRKIDRERHEYGSFFYRMPYGESGADVYDRVTTFIDTLFRDFEKDNYPKTTLLFTHGLTIKVFLMRWFHWSVDEFESYKTPNNCDIIRMDLQEDNKYKLVTPLLLKDKLWLDTSLSK